MACPSRRHAPLLAALLLPGLLGCSLHLHRVEVGSPQDGEAWRELREGVHDRGDVLALLGPPDVVGYTRTDEVLEYRQGGHRGSNLQFILTGVSQQLSVLSTFRSLLVLLFRRPEPEEFDASDPASQAANAANSQVNPVGGLRALELEGISLRYDVVRLTLDRNTLVLKQKERLRGIPANQVGSAMRGALLMDD